MKAIEYAMNLAVKELMNSVRSRFHTPYWLSRPSVVHALEVHTRVSHAASMLKSDNYYRV